MIPAGRAPLRLRHRPRPSERRVHGRRRDSGETLVELLATIILMSVGIAALMTGMVTLLRTSDQVNRQSRANLGSHGYAEFLKDSLQEYKPCATTSGVNSYVPYTGPDGYTARIVTVQYWDGTLTAGGRTPNFVNTCPSPDKGLQKVTVEVSRTDGRFPVTERVVMIKRDQRCLVPYQGRDGKPC